MEADEYFQAYDALKKGEEKCRMTLRQNDTCGINQIMWSSFDYMTGPELRFVWDIAPSNEPLCSSGGEETASGSLADDESLDSSMTTSSLQFEEIDDVMQNSFGISTLAQELSELNESTDSFDSLKNSSKRKSSSGTEVASSPADLSSLTMREESFASTSTRKPESESDLSLSLKRISGNGFVSREPSQWTSPYLSSLYLPRAKTEEEHNACVDESEVMTSGYYGSDKMGESDVLSPDEPPSEDQLRLFSSSSSNAGLHQKIGSRLLSDGSSSSNPSSLPLPNRSNSVARNAYLDDVTLELQEDSPTDEQFVAKFVLAEQICRCEWYMERQPTFQNIFMDIVPKMKASILVEESKEDTVVRLTGEWQRLLHLFGSLERFPLFQASSPIKAKRTMLVDRPEVHTAFMSRAISACLQTQGHCVLLGSNHILVNRLINTLSFFIPSELRWSCLRPFKGRSYSPYLRLQAVRKTELMRILYSACQSHWPVSVIDCDRLVVAISAPQPRHTALKRKAAMTDINCILGKTEKEVKPLKIELASVRPLEAVSTWIRRLDLLPKEESPRIAFTQQLMLFVENTAKAFVAYVKDASVPSASDKSHANRSSVFSLSLARRALDLQSDSWFSAVLARAELLRPDITDFIYM